MPLPPTQDLTKKSQVAKVPALSRKTTVWEVETSHQPHGAVLGVPKPPLPASLPSGSPGAKGTCQDSEGLETPSPNPRSELEGTGGTERRCLAQGHTAS